MYKLKKILALIMAVLMIAGCCSAAMAKESLVEDLTEYPIIFVPGYATSNLYYYDENGEEQPIWGTDPISQITGGSSGDRAKVLAEAAAEFIATGEADKLAKELNVGFRGSKKEPPYRRLEYMVPPTRIELVSKP